MHKLKYKRLKQRCRARDTCKGDLKENVEVMLKKTQEMDVSNAI